MIDQRKLRRTFRGTPLQRLWKAWVCSWLHPRCFPRSPRSWHCDKCHPCGEIFDVYLAELPDGYTDLIDVVERCVFDHHGDPPGGCKCREKAKEIMKQAHAAGQREGERKGIERAAKVADMNCGLHPEDGQWPCIQHRETGKAIRNLKVGEE